MNNIYKLILFLPLLLLVEGCYEQPPVSPDGQGYIEVKAVWDSTQTGKNVPLAYASVIITSEYGVFVRETDGNGVCILDHLPAATYNISVRKPYPLDSNIVIVGNERNIVIASDDNKKDTIFAKASSSSGICINEVYACGPVNNLFFFYDQFIELYNSSDSVKYLDGMIVARVSGGDPKYGTGPGSDYGNDGDIDTVTYAFKFPGKPGEKNYPFYPKTFKVLAVDAVNHKNVVSTSIDLSHADWEFYNQYSADDIDNPNVPNLLNMKPERTVDFLISLVGDVIVLADGTDSNLDDGLDISSIVDGMEYQSSSTLPKTLDERVDRGFVLCPPRYSGKSMQRRNAGVDTNDGNLDWEIIPHPTPGYQK